MQAPLVVFVPGFMQRGDPWGPVAERVRERYPTLCVDFATHTLEGRLEELRFAAPPGAVLVGYSMGGRLALQFALREPGRLVALVTLGAAAGIEAGDDGGDEGTISTAVGTWTVLSALIGTLVGTFIGGRFSRWQSPGSAIYHGITSWGLATLLSALLGAIGALGLLGAALRRADDAGAATGGANASEAADAISWGGWALALGMLLNLLTAIIGWHLGSRSRLTDVEREGVGGVGGPGGMGRGDRTTTTTTTGGGATATTPPGGTTGP